MATVLGKGIEKAGLRLVEFLPAVMRDITIDDDGYWKFEATIKQVVEIVYHRVVTSKRTSRLGEPGKG